MDSPTATSAPSPPASAATARAGTEANSFTFLRLVLAWAVLFSHTYPLGGFGDDPLALGGLAVKGFFILSGYLLMCSLQRRADFPAFFVRRAFRILPAFWCCLVVVGLLLAPALLQGSVAEESFWKSPWNYVAGNWFLQITQDNIPPLFAGNPFKLAVNGSLWTLVFEAECYVLLALAVWSGLFRRPVVLASLLGVFYAAVVVYWWFGWAPPAAPGLLRRSVLMIFHPASVNFGLAFFAGVLAAQVTKGKPVWSPRWLAIAAFAFVLSFPTHTTKLIWPFALPIILLNLAYRLPFGRLERFGDISYGVYLYAWPIQQTLAAFGLHHAGFIAYLAGATALSLVAGTLSWFLIERPALTLGRHLASRIATLPRLNPPLAVESERSV